MRNSRLLLAVAGLILTQMASMAYAEDALQLSPPVVNFGSVELERISMEPVRIENISTHDIPSLKIEIVQSSPDFGIIGDECESLKAGAICTLWLTFQPMVQGYQVMTLKIGEGSDAVELTVSGTAWRR